MTKTDQKIALTRRAFGAGAVATAGLAASPLRAQEKFPSKPIEVVTHAGVGGGTDITARMMMVHAPGEFGTELVGGEQGGRQRRCPRSPMPTAGRATATRSCWSRKRTC